MSGDHPTQRAMSVGAVEAERPIVAERIAS